MRTPPEWSSSVVAQAPRQDSIEVGGARVHFRSWGDRQSPGIILLHGGAANTAWWDHVGPLLGGYHVVAIDLSGHGLSDWRAAYSLTGWSEEVVAVIRSLEFDRPPLVVGHSMGGVIAYLVAQRYGAELAGMIIVDTPFPPAREAHELTHRHSVTPPHTYPDLPTIIGRFRLLPGSEVCDPHVLKHVAHESVKEIDGGWTWRFDPRFFAHEWLSIDALEAITGCPTAVVRAAHGLQSEAEAEAVAHAIGSSGRVVTVSGSGHHVPLEQPVAMGVLIATFAHFWA